MTWLSDWICKNVGHKQGCFPNLPWKCERCEVDFKEEWERKLSKKYYAQLKKDNDELQKLRNEA